MKGVKWRKREEAWAAGNGRRKADGWQTPPCLSSSLQRRSSYEITRPEGEASANYEFTKVGEQPRFKNVEQQRVRARSFLGLTSQNESHKYATYAERTAVAGVSNVQWRTSAGAAENQKSNPLDESRVQARPSLSTLSPESNQPEEHYSLGIQSTLRQHDALAWKGNPNRSIILGLLINLTILRDANNYFKFSKMARHKGQY
ncbi:hypothetical protein K0M31_019478 [Melipona bicolor]|uniref:Uncharacterized protein n=1 Tax=Melipona bicolor TaxID=60889 RepID=A0AA40KR62_9HYME|nr:hypothetical protein K0M31_019478 [Melipona bicolor]